MKRHALWEKFKDYFTDTLGLVIMLATSYGVWVGNTIPLIWDGIAGLLVGFVLLMFPDGVIVSFIKGWARKRFGEEEDKPEP